MPDLHKLREPAAVVLLVVLGLRLLLGAVMFLVLARGGDADTYASLSRSAHGNNAVALASFSLANTVIDLLTATLLVAVVASCVLWRPTPHARQLTVAALVLISVAAVVALVAGVVWLANVRASMGALADFGRLVLGLPLLVLAAAALRRLLAATALGAVVAQPTRELSSTGSASGTPPTPQLPVAAADEPTWQPEEAAGAAWLTAGDAATGAAASGWGTSTERGGWVPGETGAPSAAPEEERQRRDQWQSRPNH